MTDDASTSAAPKKRHFRRATYGAEECFANMAMLWRYHGRQPRCAEADKPPSTVGHAAYKRRSGSWMRALEAFAAFSGIEMRQGAPEKPTNSNAALFAALSAGAARPQDGMHRDGMHPARSPSRAVPLGLRFQVLQRDRFKCAACGNSPAADAACKLHVDHIEQWSRGGKTEAGNLRTLCAACNLGRGARAER